VIFGDCGFSERPFEGTFVARVNFDATSSLVVSLEYRIFSATQEFVTKRTDTLATQPFNGTLITPINFTRSILGSDIIGAFTSGQGKLELSNVDGTYDFLIERFAIDGRDVVIKVGREGDSYNNFYTVFNGVAADWSVQEDVVDITLVDNGYKLAVPAQSNLYGGTGGLDGTADLVGKRKPRAFGPVQNVSPPLVIPNSLVYQVNDGPILGITNVYDRGVALTLSADYANSTLLLAAVIPAGQYATCSAEGLFRLNTSPSGTVTADVSGDYTGAVFAFTSADIVQRLVTKATVLTTADLYLPSFTAVNAVQGAAVGYWIAPDDTTTVADVLAQIMGGIGGWAGFRRTGKLEVGIFRSPTGQTPSAFFDRTDIFEIRREKLPSTLSPPPYRFRVSYGRNWTVQTDTAGSVSAARKGFLAESARYADSSNTSVLADHPFAQDRDPVASYFLTEYGRASGSGPALGFVQEFEGALSHQGWLVTSRPGYRRCN
jgi:hypothetical protein